MWVNKNKFTVHKKFMNYIYWNNFPISHIIPKTQVPVVNNQICSPNILTQNWLISPCSQQGTEKTDVYGETCERQTNHDLIKVKFFAEKIILWGSCLVRLLDGSNLWIADKMGMTPLEVRCLRGKFLPHSKWYSFNYINTRWSSWYEGLGLSWVSCSHA